MTKCFFKLFVIYVIQQQVISHLVNAEDTVSAFKYKLKEQIREIQLASKLDEPQEFMDNYDLIVGQPTETRNKHPHLRSGHRHRHRGRKHRTNMRTSANVTSTTNGAQTTVSITDSLQINSTASNVTDDSFETHVRLLEGKVEVAIANLTNYLRQADIGNVITTYSPRRGNQKVSPRIPFYRKFNYFHDVERNKPQKWVHCLDLITPRLQGMTDESKLNLVTAAHGDVRRLAQLLFTDVSTFNAEDMVSLLSQISKIRIRMFHWDQNAMTIILNVIIRGPIHDFKTLKTGLMDLISRWHLDISNMKVFLQQTRIFRPPCIDISGYIGFTKKPGGVIPYTKPDKPKKKKRDPNVSCKSREKHVPYDNNNP